MRDGVLVLDQQNRVVDLNRQARKILAITSDPTGKPAGDIVPRWEVFLNNKATNIQPPVELQLSNAAYELQLDALYDRHGEVVGRMLNLRDITARKQAEATLRLQSAALQASANAIAITDAEANFMWVNPAFSNLTGYNVEEVIGQSPRLLKSGLVDPAVYEDLWKTILAGRPWSGELINRRKDGSVYPEEQTITPVLDDQGQVLYFIVVKQDISERKALEGLRNDLTYMLVHDLRNPLSQTQLALSMLQEEDGEVDNRQEILKIADLGLSRMESLVNDILDINRLRTAKPLAYEQVSAQHCSTASSAPCAGPRRRMLRLLSNLPADLPLLGRCEPDPQVLEI
jgi:PAS domain S-box-containing protein